MNLKLKEKIKESLSAVLPITGIVLMLSIFLVPMELGSIVMFLTGAVMLIVGMGFFQLGAEMAMTPIGEGVGVQISKMKKLITVLLTGARATGPTPSAIWSRTGARPSNIWRPTGAFSPRRPTASPTLPSRLCCCSGTP